MWSEMADCLVITRILFFSQGVSFIYFNGRNLFMFAIYVNIVFILHVKVLPELWIKTCIKHKILVNVNDIHQIQWLILFLSVH